VQYALKNPCQHSLLLTKATGFLDPVLPPSNHAGFGEQRLGAPSPDDWQYISSQLSSVMDTEDARKPQQLQFKDEMFIRW
jgi:hypothetical protein